MLTLGDKAPDFTAESTHGSISSADLRGKKLLLLFYPKNETSG